MEMFVTTAGRTNLAMIDYGKAISLELNIPFIEKEQNGDYCQSLSGKNDPLSVFNVKSNNNIPDVMGMLASDAIYELSKAGYKVIIEGKGRVKKITPKGDKVVELRLTTPLYINKKVDK